MRYRSTNGKAPEVSLGEAVVRGLAPDRGLYVPERITVLPDSFFSSIQNMSFVEIAFRVACAFFGEDISEDELRTMVNESLSFDCPLVQVEGNISSLELFHGPTLAFKDVGARFMARMLRHFSGSGTLNVLVATSGDTGSAVANGFLGVDGIRVFVLYPKGKVSPIQECQFTTLGRNIIAIEVDGTFDDCQALVKSAFVDDELNALMRLSSANSINVARFLPQSFYYFNAYARMRAEGRADNLVISVPSGNFGNICSALYAVRMGLPVKRFIAANNANCVFRDFLCSGNYEPRPSVPTIANAMDVGDPSNFARIWDLFGRDIAALRSSVSSVSYSDAQIGETIRETLDRCGYLLDPHGACAYRALREGLEPGENGVFCETAHPAKFKDTVEKITGKEVIVPDALKAFMGGVKQTVPLSPDYYEFRNYLMSKI